MKTEYIYLGTNCAVVKVSKDKGEVVWRTVLKPTTFMNSGHHFVSLLVEGDRVFVHTIGELFCLEVETGRIVWRNPLSGLGGQLGTLASVRGSSCPDQIFQAEQDPDRSS